MEELLNKLIEKGWKPFGWPYYDRFIIERDWDMCFKWQYPWTDWTHSYDYNFDYFKIRELVSKDSWLWQFCVENNLVKTKDKKVRYRYEDLERTQNYFSWYWYEYRIIESALCNEEDLEKFLLENIKI